MPTSTTPTKERLIDTAVAVIEAKVGEVLQARDPSSFSFLKAGYVDADDVAIALTRQGLISHEHQDSKSYSAQEQARRSLRGKAKRLLDAEVAKPDARIIRLSSRDDAKLPCLDGQVRHPYGNEVVYTTPAFYERASAAVQARLDQERAEDEIMVDLLRQASEAGLPRPIKSDRFSVTYDVDGLRGLIARVVHLKNEVNYLVTGEE